MLRCRLLLCLLLLLHRDAFLQSEHVWIFCCNQIDNGIAPAVPATRNSLLTDARIAKVV